MQVSLRSCFLKISIAGLMSQGAFAGESKFLQISCLSGGANGRQAFTGWILGTAEPMGDGFVVKGSKIEVFAKKIDNPSCRFFYDEFVQEDNVGPGTWKRYNREWNAKIVKAASGVTYMTCAIGSEYTENSDPTVPFKMLTRGLVDSPQERRFSVSNVSSKDCLINGLVP
ncbi:MAG: hypothetical protein NT027_19475 [Proteobacteria bacterium]|nr:hypothetical protein [Pseudomonadota bacterium]